MYLLTWNGNHYTATIIILSTQACGNIMVVWYYEQISFLSPPEGKASAQGLTLYQWCIFLCKDAINQKSTETCISTNISNIMFMLNLFFAKILWQNNKAVKLRGTIIFLSWMCLQGMFKLFHSVLAAVVLFFSCKQNQI